MNLSITILCNSFPPETGAGPTRIYNLAQMLHQRGYKVEVITSMPNYPTGKIFPGYRNKIVQKEIMDGVLVRRIWQFPSNSKLAFKRIVSMLSQTTAMYMLALPYLLKKKPSIILVSSPPILLGYAGVIISKITGSKSVLNISDLWPLSALELGYIQKGSFYRLLEGIEKRMYKLSDAVVGQSNEILEHIKGKSTSDKNNFLYRNLQENNLQPSEINPSGKKKIVYAGMLGIAQGVLNMIQAINFTELNVELHIYGEGFEKPEIIAFIQNNPNNGVVYHDSIPGKAIPEMLRQYHATLIPLTSIIHGAVPSKIFMAISNGLPVLFSGGGEGAQIIIDGKIGWVNKPSDFEGLKHNIKTFSKISETEYQQLKNNCWALTNDLFNKEKQDQAFDMFLQQL